MLGSELIDGLRRELGCRRDSELEQTLGVSAGRVSQVRSKSSIGAKYASSLIAKICDERVAATFRNAIIPVVEFYPIERSSSSQEASYIPFDATTDSGVGLRKALTSSAGRKVCGVYAFYNSQGEIIYFGKTEKQNLFQEIKNAYNRQMRNCNIYRVRHPSGKYKPTGGGTIRQIQRENVYLYQVSEYFSAYDVRPELVGAVESLVIRLTPNDLINARIEKKALSILPSAKL